MKARKRRAAAALAVVLAASMAFTGCSVRNKAVATVNGEKIPYKVANFYVRYYQASYESYYLQQSSAEFWHEEVEEEGGKTYEELLLQDMIDSLKQMYILEDHMEDYDVEITSDEKADIREAAAQFMRENDEDTVDFMTASEEVVERVLTLVTIQQKMTVAIEADVDTEVSDEEAAQKKMNYVQFSYYTTDEFGMSVELSDEQKEEQKKLAEELQKKAKESGDLKKTAEKEEKGAQEATFDSGSENYAEELIEAADKLKKGEISDMIVAEDGCYVAQLVSTFDREATDAQKPVIVEERKQELFDETYEKWEKEADYKLDKDVWAKINFDDGITVKEKEETTESTPTDAE